MSSSLRCHQNHKCSWWYLSSLWTCSCRSGSVPFTLGPWIRWRITPYKLLLSQSTQGCTTLQVGTILTCQIRLSLGSSLFALWCQTLFSLYIGRTICVWRFLRTYIRKIWGPGCSRLSHGPARTLSMKNTCAKRRNICLKANRESLKNHLAMKKVLELKTRWA